MNVPRKSASVRGRPFWSVNANAPPKLKGNTDAALEEEVDAAGPGKAGGADPEGARSAASCAQTEFA